MTPLLSVAKAVGGPGSLGFLIVGLLTGALCLRLWPARGRAIRVALAALVSGYAVLAIPAVSLTIVAALPAVPAPGPGEIRQIETLVVFDGDNLAGRQRRANQVLRQVVPREVWLLGPDYLAADLRVAMAPGQTLHHDGTTRNTSDQVDRVRSLSTGHPASATAVIASRVQMPRIAAMFESAGSSVLLVPSPLDREPAASGLAGLVPSLAGLAASRDAIYEHAALVYYRWRGHLP